MSVHLPSPTTVSMAAMLCCLLVIGAATDASASQRETPTWLALRAPQSLAPGNEG